jgi:hypothetical protein
MCVEMYCMQKLQRKLLAITAPKTYAGRHQSICNECRFAKDIHFALQMRRNILSLLVAFRQTQFQIKPLLSAKTLAVSLKTQQWKYSQKQNV